MSQVNKYQEYDKVIANTLSRVFRYVSKKSPIIQIKISKSYFKTYKCKVFLEILKMAQSLYPFTIEIDCSFLIYRKLKKTFLKNKFIRKKLSISYSETIIQEIKMEMGISDDNIFEEIYKNYYIKEKKR